MIAGRPLGTTDAWLDAVVVAAAGRCLRAPVETLAPDVPLSLLGLDSLAAVELAADLESTLGRPVPDTLLEDCPNLRALADRLRRFHSQSPGRPDPFDRMLADAVLPDDVRPRQPVNPAASLRGARRILLTGATGFLGSWLARELLLTTDAIVYCVVRPTGGVRAQDRLLAALATVNTSTCPRVRVIEGDLTESRLGLARADYEALAGDVDAICHAGALVNWVYSYDGLRHANVLGTLELVRLACRGRPLPFHFVSSLSVGYSTAGPRRVDEGLDPLSAIRGLHLGYAQSKAVADALVLEAGRRGLPVRIYRPGLIAGDSRTGAFNPGDLLATLVRGSVHMGTAPDLDWKLDCQPVDWMARAIVQLSARTGPVFHLAHPRPRHWRECVLWMRLYGYPLRLVPYHAWLRQLDAETSASTSHPLRPLRSFFLDRHRDARGLTLPELYEEGRRARASHARTDVALGGMNADCPALDAALLDTYFGAFVAAGVLTPPVEETEGTEAAEFLHHRGTEITEVHCGEDTPVCLTPLVTGSIIAELSAWRSRRPTGLFHARIAPAPGKPARDAIVKIKAPDEDAIAVGEALAHLCDPTVGVMYSKWRDRIGLTASHLRELAIYGQSDPRFVRHTPGVLGITSDAASGTWLVALERIDDAVLMDSAGQRDVWSEQAMCAVIDGLATLQSIWYARERELASRDWIGPIMSAQSMADMRELWAALATHAAPAFSSWSEPAIGALQRRLIGALPTWWSHLEQSPRTLIHNDFNPRNICLRWRGGRLRLCAYDWELATVGAPQRDLVEFLCFVLPTDASRRDVEGWVARHRAALEREAGVRIDADEWRKGFAAALYDLLITRLGIYALIHRVRRQAFLPNVVKTWHRLYDLYPLESVS